MSSIFEEIMTSNRKITESKIRRPKKSKKTEGRKINFKHLKVESRKIFEEAEPEELEKEFEVPEQETPDEVVLVIDPQANSDEEIPEEAAEDMIGDAVYKCPVCGANYVCNCNEDGIYEDVTVDEEGVPTECPICGDDAEQILVGEIAPVDEATGDDTDLPPQNAEDTENDIDDEDFADEVPEDEEFEEESLKKSSRKLARRESAKKSSKNRKKCEGLLEDDDLNDDLNDAEMILDIPCEGDECYEDKDNDAPDIVVTDSDVTFMLDDTKLESMLNRLIRENYKGAPRCKITKVRSNGRTLKIEYVVRCNGKSLKGRLIGEGYAPKSKRFSIAFRNIGKTFESVSKSPIMKVDFVRSGRQIIPTQMDYNYRVKVNESLYRVKGHISGFAPQKNF